MTQILFASYAIMRDRCTSGHKVSLFADQLLHHGSFHFDRVTVAESHGSYRINEQTLERYGVCCPSATTLIDRGVALRDLRGIHPGVFREPRYPLNWYSYDLERIEFDRLRFDEILGREYGENELFELALTEFPPNNTCPDIVALRHLSALTPESQPSCHVRVAEQSQNPGVVPFDAGVHLDALEEFGAYQDGGIWMRHDVATAFLDLISECTHMHHLEWFSL